MKVVGISSCFVYADENRSVFWPKTLSYVESDMFDFIAQSGVLPILIPNLPNERLVEIIDFCDGFIFQGGTDLSPNSYGEKPIVEGKWLGDPERDEYEMRLMKTVMGTGKPVFGVCRGMQLMNAYFGGTLYQDIQTQRPEASDHRNHGLYDKVHHELDWKGDFFLEKLYAEKSNPRINSVHHQAVKDLAPDLEVMAVSSSDGIIEAVQVKGSNGKIFAVQWHPEFSHTLGDVVLPGEPIMKHFLDQIENKA
jgi:putative glutamine amidotransferase